MEPEPVSGVDEDGQLLVKQRSLTSSQLFRIRRMSVQRTSTCTPPPSDDFSQFVSKLLGRHVRRIAVKPADLADARPPLPVSYTHLTLPTIYSV